MKSANASLLMSTGEWPVPSGISERPRRWDSNYSHCPGKHPPVLLGRHTEDTWNSNRIRMFSPTDASSTMLGLSRLGTTIFLDSDLVRRPIMPVSTSKAGDMNTAPTAEPRSDGVRARTMPQCLSRKGALLPRICRVSNRLSSDCCPKSRVSTWVCA